MADMGAGAAGIKPRDRALRIPTFPGLTADIRTSTGLCIALLLVVVAAAVFSRSDRPLVILIPAVATLAVLLMAKKHAAELIAAGASLCLAADAVLLTPNDRGAIALSAGISGLLGIIATIYSTRVRGPATNPVHRYTQVEPAGRAPSAGVDPANASVHWMSRHRRPCPQPNTATAKVAAAPTELHRDRLETLSNRQLEVVELVLEGLTAREIGLRLFISERTVETHMATVYERLDVHSRRQLYQLYDSLGGTAEPRREAASA